MTMAAEHAPNASEYIIHHLTHLNSLGHKQTALVDWSVFHLDTLFWSVTIGLFDGAGAGARCRQGNFRRPRPLPGRCRNHG